MVTVALSSLNPIALNYALDEKFVIKSNTIYFDKGFYLYEYPLLQNCQDVIINKDNLFFLTDSIQLHNTVEVLGDDTLNPADYVGSTSIAVSGGGTWNIRQDVLGTQDNNILQTQDLFFIRFTGNTPISASDVGTTDSILFFIDLVGSQIAIRDPFDQFLTFDPIGLGMMFDVAYTPDTNNLQHFSYLIDNNSIVLFTATPLLTAQRTVYFDTATKLLSTMPAVSITTPISANNIFTLVDFVDTGFNNFTATQSNWVAYDTNEESIKIDTTKTIQDTSHNLLISSAFKGLSANSLNVNINNLKSYQTPEYGYTLSANNPVGRTYSKLIAGVNQEDGYDNLFLSFSAQTQEIIFDNDKYTYFHYATTAASSPLSASTLINNGAYANETPWRSDKLFKKQADYKNYSNTGNANIQNGVWFCSWLQGSNSPGVSPTWMDRYFNPSYAYASGTTLQTALLTAVSNTLLDNIGNPIIWDVPSTMLFEPGVLYIYHHIGETRAAEIAKGLKTNFNVLEFTQWGSKTNNIITDSSPSGLNGNIFGFTLSANQATLDNIANTCYDVSGSYGYVEKVGNIFSSDELTISFLVNASDWTNIIGNQIVGNYHNGGIGVFNNNPIITPYITLFDQTSGYVFHANSNFAILNKTNFIPYLGHKPVKIIKTNYDEDYFILDTSQNILAYDIENVLQNVISLTALVPSISAAQLEIDGNYDFHVIDKAASMYYKVSSGGSLLSSVSLSGDMMVIDYNNNPIFPIVKGVVSMAINSLGNVFYATNNLIYRDNIVIWQASDIQDMVCDHLDNIWVLYGLNKVAKFDSVNNLLAVLTTPVSSISTGHRSLSYHRELTPVGVSDYIFVYDSRTKYAYKITPDGKFTASTPISAFDNSLTPLSGLNLVGTTDNGFNFQRKYIQPNLVLPGISARVFLREQYINGTTKKIRLQASTKDFQGTKFIAVTFNYTRGTIKLLVDGVVVDSATFDPFKYRISSNKNTLSLVFGADSSKRFILNKDILQDGYYTFNGIIGDFRIFDKELSTWDIRAINANSKKIAFSPVIWNMPIGNRNFIEEVDHFFKHKIPGNKSQFFNIKLTGLNISDIVLRNLIEDSIKSVLRRINPVHTTLYKIIWS